VTERIIIAVDGRPESRDAVQLASELAAATGAELDAAAVLDYSPLPIDLEPYEVALRDHFERIFEQVTAQAPGVTYTAHRLTGPSPAGALSALAEELKPIMVVLGSTHRGRVGRVLPGSLGDRLLGGGPSPVAIAPRGYAESTHALERIGVGFDGRGESAVALAFAAGIAESLGAGLRLIAVLPPPSSTLEAIVAPLGYEEALRERLEGALAEGAAAFPAIDTETSLLAGDPAATLAAESDDLDLIVVGSRGYGPLRRALLGNVNSQLTREAACPTIVVPRAWSGPASEPAGT
jgi:nucleotide-binding universal stress UspA family protein